MKPSLPLLILWHVLAWSLGGFMVGAFVMAATGKELQTVALALGVLGTAALMECIDREF